MKGEEHLTTGKLGEEMALKYLECKGYKIIQRNFRTGRGEIDIIAEKNESLIFVEVRTKVGERFGAPEETIDRRKRYKLRGNAKAYAAYKHYKGRFQVDAICLVLNDGATQDRLTHYENICTEPE